MARCCASVLLLASLWTRSIDCPRWNIDMAARMQRERDKARERERERERARARAVALLIGSGGVELEVLQPASWGLWTLDQCDAPPPSPLPLSPRII